MRQKVRGLTSAGRRAGGPRYGLTVSVLFVGVILVEGSLRPGYEQMHRFGSELALGERGWVQIANFVT